MKHPCQEKIFIKLFWRGLRWNNGWIHPNPRKDISLDVFNVINCIELKKITGIDIASFISGIETTLLDSQTDWN